MTTTTRASAKRITETGTLLLTCGIHHYMNTGCTPYCDEEHDSSHTESWRRHFVAVALTSHMDGCWGDTSPDDARMNDEVFSDGDGGRLMSTWDRSGFPRIWIITEAYNTPQAYTTVLFPSEY